MEKPNVAGRRPVTVEVEHGKTYHWCACGLSKNQPFCDGSHKGTGFTPTVWVAEESGHRSFCLCKGTGNRPLCDGSHNRLDP